MKKEKKKVVYGILAVLLCVASVVMTFLPRLTSNDLSIQEIFMGECRMITIPVIAILIICVIGLCADMIATTHKHKERIKKFVVFAQLVFLAYLFGLGVLYK